MKAAQHFLIVLCAVFMPLAACGARVVGEETENPGPQAGAAETSTPNNAPDAGPAATATATATAKPVYPCSSNTAAYYTDAGPPPATGGCRDLYTPSERHPAGCTMTIVAPIGGGACTSFDCVCSTSGSWVATGSTPAHFCP